MQPQFLAPKQGRIGKRFNVKRLRERAEKELGNADRWQELVSKSPFGRMATIEELGAMVTFLCSPLSGYTTGTIITVDGGASSRRA